MGSRSGSVRRLRRALGVLLLGCGLGLAGCATDPGAGQGVDPQAATLGLTAAPAGLDLTTTGGAAIVQALLGNVYQGLVGLDETGAIQPLLATDWQISPDGLRYTFTLREGVTFHDGTPLTAEAVAASIEHIPSWSANSPSQLAAIDHVEIDSPHQVTLILADPDFDVLYRLAGPLGIILSPAALADPSALTSTAIGTGPFLLESYQVGTRLVLARNPDYWGTPAASPQVVLRYFADPSAAVNAIRTGGVDALYGAEAYDLLVSLAERDDLAIATGATQGVVVVTMNTTRDDGDTPLADPLVRWALTRAVDKKAVVEVATAGLGTVLPSPALPGDPYGLDPDAPDLPDLSYNPDAARALLAQAGVRDLDLTFTVPNRPYAQAVAQVLQAQFAEVGVRVRLVTQEFPAVWVQQTMGNRSFDLTVVNHVETRSLWGYADPGYYWSYDSAAARGLFDRARAATDQAGYAAAVSDAVALIVADAPGIWLYSPPNVVVTRPGVSGVPLDDLGVGIDLSRLRVA